MSLYVQLGLVAGMMNLSKENPITSEQNPVLFDVLGTLGVRDIVGQDRVQIRERYLQILSALETSYEYYDPSELQVTPLVDTYLAELFKTYQSGRYEMTREVSIRICAIGDKKGTPNSSAGVGLFIGELARLVASLEEVVDKFPEAYPAFQHDLFALEYVDHVLDIVNTYVLAKTGQLAGVTEYPPVDVNSLSPIDPPDFVVEACVGDASCNCGCSDNEHAMVLLQGLEDFLDNNPTYSARYAMGVIGYRQHPFDVVSGNEGPILDGIKDMGSKAYAAIVESLKALGDLFDPKSDDEKVKAIEAIAENNKKALQAMDDKSIAINPAAKEGLAKLSLEVYPDGEMKTITASLETAADGPRAIDALLALLQKEVGSESALQASQATAEKSADALKAASDKASSGDETNKDMIGAIKEKVKETTKDAKDAVKTVKGNLTGHSKKMNGIKKAINGISPHIFPSAKAEPEAK